MQQTILLVGDSLVRGIFCDLDNWWRRKLNPAQLPLYTFDGLNRTSSWDDKTRVTTADLRAPVDAELRGVALKLALCYFVPDVSWVLRPVDAAAKKARW